MKCLGLLTFILLCTQDQGAATNDPRITGRHGHVEKSMPFFQSSKREFDIKEDLDIFDINRDIRDVDLIDGDVLPNRDGRSAIIDTSRYWPTTVVPVAYSSDLSLLAQAGIDEARLEYEMRTCFSFVDRTDEDDYIFFQPLSGCYSGIGKQGGAQTISIGNGCEKHGTVQHELMHSIGIYHQQSRADRDNYITIEYDNIQDGKQGNFNKYDYTKVDDERVPYDYNSVMHYSDTGFSTNGQPTIVTNDPAFQDVIGQRRTFSPGDANMINRMYKCGDPLRHSYSCGFEEESVCGYVQDKEDDLDFYRTSVSASPQLGSDNTYGEAKRGTVMMLDAHGVGTANMATMRLHTNSSEQCLQFSYNMQLYKDTENAGISVSMAEIDEVTGDIVSTTSLVTITGDHGQYWNLERFTIQAPSKHYKIVFSAKNAVSKDIIAIDDVQVQDRACDTTYVQIHEWSSLLAQVGTSGDAVYTGPLYTDEGYAFQLKIYPRGKSGSSGDYMGLYFGLTQGDNDDTLQWPFANQVVRLQVEDQNPDVQVRMNQFSQFMTSDDNDIWDKPDGSFSAWGFSSFMPLSDIENTRNFLKNDAIVISINVRDMNTVTHSTVDAPDVDLKPVQPKPGQKAQDEASANEDTDRHIDVDIKVGTPSTEAEDSSNSEHMMSYSLAMTLIVSCSLFVFVCMITVLLCFASNHSRSMKAVLLANQKSNKTIARFNNIGYATNDEKV